MILFKKVIRTMLDHKARYIGSILLLMISSMMFVMMNMTSINLNNTFRIFSEKNLLSDAEFSTTADIDMTAVGRQFDAKVESGGTADCQVKPGQTLRTFSAMNRVNIPSVQEGKLPDSSEIMLDGLFAKTNGYKIGHKITLSGREFTVSGYALLPNFIYVIKSKEEMMNDPRTFGVGVVGKPDFETLPAKTRVYALRFNKRENIKSQEASVKNALRSQGIQITNWQSTGRKVNVSYVPMEVDVLSTMSAAVPFAMLALTCILLGMLMWRMIQRESVIIGTFYAQGYRRSQIRRHYLMFPLLISLTGSVTGSLLGLLLVNSMFRFTLTAFPMPVYESIINAWLVISAIALPVIILCGVTLCIIGRTLKTAPAVLMKGGKAKGRVNFIERSLRLDRFGFNTKFKIREQVRSLSRSFFLLFGVIVASMLMLYGLTMKSSVDYMLDEGIKELYNFKYEYVFKSVKTETPPSGTEQFNAAYVTLSSNENISFYVTGVLPDTKKIRLKDASGQSFKPEQITITATLAKKLNVKAGGIIRVFDTGDGKIHTFTIEKIADTYAGDFLFMPLDQFNAEFKYPKDAYLGIWSNKAMSFPQGDIQSTKSMDTIAAGFAKLISQMGPMIYGLIAAAFILGLIIIYIVTGLVVDESRTSISLMKVFGYRKKEIEKLILDSNTMIVILGYLIGIPTLLGTAGAFFASLTESLQIVLPVKLNILYMLFGFIVVMATYGFAKWMCGKKTARIPMSEALKAGTE
ncbi:ABC transporter permease [Clostridium sp. HV4-5-A1G]|uniref:ABC transporter permease n=1 Tax=Clostridium sp. HV4-5-A1G TaxID=2004595 RepID=UPI001238F3B7|nr:FtsX-like permease family protein [Clostridium sp. HV4-5-A1G]KAA8678146.1 FtsX-like permease family protein [Clostridium sp. HV4-5-A1G]